MLRFVVDGLVRTRLGARLPWGTAIINVSGSFLLGLLTGLATRGMPQEVLVVAGTGLLGGYTTFSTASVETVRLLQQRRIAASLVYGARRPGPVGRRGAPGPRARRPFRRSAASDRPERVRLCASCWRASSAATQASIAHFTRAVYLETPPSTTASPSSSSSGSIRPFERIAVRNASIRTCSSAAVSPGARSARIEADDCEIAHPSPSQRIRSMRSPSRCSCSVTSSPHVGLIWCDDAAAPSSSPFACGRRARSRMTSWYRLPSAGAHARTPKKRTASRDAVEQHVDLGARRVHRGAGAGGGGDAEPPVQGLRAVVADPHRDAAVVEELADVVRVHALDHEAREPDARLARCGAEEADAVDRGDALGEPGSELGLVRGDPRHADRLQVAHRGGEADRLRDRLRAGLEALRRREVLGALHRHGGDHRPAGEERRQRVQQLPPPVERADARSAPASCARRTRRSRRRAPARRRAGSARTGMRPAP